MIKSLNITHILLLLASSLITSCNENYNPAADSQSGLKDPSIITINTANRLAEKPANPAGVVSCWLLDSDIERPRAISFKTAMQEMGVKYIRFPYGELADNYLWDADGDFGGALTPKVDVLSRAPGSFQDASGNYWAVDQETREFKKDMDFDEYMTVCQELGATPMVVVNVASFKRSNSNVTKEYLINSAAEWVKYANITKDYKVKRWAIGNEVDHQNEFEKVEYISLYKEFAQAMKAVDPSIMVGPGLLNKWHNDLLTQAGELVDFVCVHNYLFPFEWTSNGYEGWRDTNDTGINNVDAVQNVIEASSKPNLEIHVTEYNSRPWKSKPEDDDDFFRALVLGEMTLNSIRNKNVVATYCWNTHSPWNGPDEDADYDLLDQENNRKPRGEALKIINNFNLKWQLGVRRTARDTRIYASASEDNDQINIIIINKGLKSDTLTFELEGFKINNIEEVLTYVSNESILEPDPFSKSPVVMNDRKELIKDINDKNVTVEIPALSMTAFSLR